MIFTKPMIDLAKEIRRRAPSELKPSLKMANPELFDELVIIYQYCKDSIMRALIKELCYLAGEPWANSLVDTAKNSRPLSGQPTQRDYQAKGNMTDSMTDSTPRVPKKSRRIYRGQIVHD